VRLLDGALRDKARLTGNPVRDAVLQNAGRLYAASSDGEPFRLLVFGGSQGARFFSDAVPPALVRLPEELRRRLRVTQQCREEDLERVEDRYEAHGIKAELATFFKDLPERMASSHLVMARAGASSVAELAVLGVPSVLVPLPHALDNDQLQNATQLAEAGACWAVEQRTLTETGLAELMARLMASPEELEKAAAAARNQGRGDAAVRLADLVEEFMGLRASGGARDLASERAHAPARLSGGH
jgi:UDP-N-acetylglucosamine--N-acetylmuramyl-(pentapeptide) pyrophosphoryl-undecaprenol N-acetylglucosamine transferase